jgi:hypothetical protein
VVSVINQTWEEQSFEFNLKNAKEVSGLEVYSLSGPDDFSYNEPGIEEPVVISGPEKMEISDSYKVGPYSANLFRFTLND